MPHHNLKWTPDRLATLRELASQKMYAAEIGRRLGTTKGSVTGACDRYGIDLLRPEGGRRKSNTVVRKCARSIVIQRQGFNAKAPPELLKPSTFKARTVDVVTLNLSLFDLPANGCRYVTTDDAPTHLFCGLIQKEGSSYCADHHALCWRMPITGSRRVA